MSTTITNANGKFVKIDSNKLRGELKKRALTCKAVEQECGFGQSTFSNYVRSSLIPRTAIELLSMKYNLPLDAYKSDESKKAEVETTTMKKAEPNATLTKEDLNELYKVIYSATYDAMKQALNE